MFTKLEFEWDLNGMGPWNPTMVETSQYIKYLSELRYTLTVSLRNHKRETFFPQMRKNLGKECTTHSHGCRQSLPP